MVCGLTPQSSELTGALASLHSSASPSIPGRNAAPQSRRIKYYFEGEFTLPSTSHRAKMASTLAEEERKNAPRLRDTGSETQAQRHRLRDTDSETQAQRHRLRDTGSETQARRHRLPVMPLVSTSARYLGWGGGGQAGKRKANGLTPPVPQVEDSPKNSKATCSGLLLKP